MRTRRLHTPGGRPVDIVVDQEIGSGAEGVVYPVADSPHVCAKIYSDFDRSAASGPRLDALTALEPVTWGGDCPEHLHVAWPRTTLRDGKGQLRGVVVPRIEGTPLLRLLDAGARIELLDEPTWRTTFAIAARLGRLFDMLHGAGIVIGDVSPANVLVDRHGHVTLLDCDGVQFTDPATGTRFAGEKFTPEYGAPEALDVKGLTREHDLFGLGVVICQLMMEGEHPFGGVSTAVPPSTSVEENIKRRNNRLTHPDRLVPMADSISAEILPPKVRDLIQQCFEDGYDDPLLRPSGRAWSHVLEQASFELMGCRYNPRHAYHRSAPECIWCARIAGGFGDHFPPPADWVPPPGARPLPLVPVETAGAVMTRPPVTYPAPPWPYPRMPFVPVPAAPPAPAPRSSRKQALRIVVWAVAVVLAICLLIAIFGH
ncbi:protein kinase domain-containing protein [Actinoplanes sp. CA-030573]|uniref:protein kinase domain-containing protein n=1 Tax=Actinoplanes sp. CA-030573 TaxID=3239898 RepID=UPI003D922472